MAFNPVQFSSSVLIHDFFFFFCKFPPNHPFLANPFCSWIITFLPFSAFSYLLARTPKRHILRLQIAIEIGLGCLDGAGGGGLLANVRHDNA